MKKRYFLFTLLVGLFTIMMCPKVFAADVEIQVRYQTSGAPAFNIVATKDVTTGTQIKTEIAGHNVDIDNYLVLKSNYHLFGDNDVICSEEGTCFPSQNGYTSTIYLMEIDHTERNVTLKSIPATDEMMFDGLYQTNYELFDDLTEPLSCNATFTLCTFKSITQNSFKAYDNVTISYDYNDEISDIAQEVVNNGLLNKTDFVATDTELLYYINYGGSLANYTSEFKNQLSNINFTFEMDQRGGALEPFETAEIGFYKFLYNGTIYAIKDFMSVTASHIIYIPTDSTNVVEAIEARLTDLFADKVYIDVEESQETINELLNAFGLPTIGTDGDNLYYILTVNNQNDPRVGMQFFVMVEKDSTKINNTSPFRSSDLLTNVSVSADESLPLDTLLDVNKITSGNEYDKIIQVLDIEEGEMFDINLYSNAEGRNITSLGNGKFLVSIPIPEKYAGKKLIIYYVDANDKVTPYEVVVDKNTNMATFETDHFSVYTLALNPVQDDTTNPATGDNIMTYVGIGVLSMITLVVLGYVSLKNKKMKDKQ